MDVSMKINSTRFLMLLKASVPIVSFVALLLDDYDVEGLDMYSISTGF